MKCFCLIYIKYEIIYPRHSNFYLDQMGCGDSKPAPPKKAPRNPPPAKSKAPPVTVTEEKKPEPVKQEEEPKKEEEKPAVVEDEEESSSQAPLTPKAKTKLYGHYMQPSCRSVIWFFKYIKKPYEFCVVDMIAGQESSKDFRDMTPEEYKQLCNELPKIADGPVEVKNDSAILTYLSLSDESGEEPTFPLNGFSSQERARIAEYIGRHHARGSYYNKFYSTMMLEKDEEALNEARTVGWNRIYESLMVYNDILGKQKYVAGDKLTIADFLFAPVVCFILFSFILNVSNYNIVKTPNKTDGSITCHW